MFQNKSIYSLHGPIIDPENFYNKIEYLFKRKIKSLMIMWSE
jgi:hypothetical protein